MAAGAIGAVPGLGVATAPVGQAVPVYWRELLAEALERSGSSWSVADLLEAISECGGAGLVDVAGWLCDEMSMGRVHSAVGEDRPGWPQRFELTPGAASYRRRLSR